MSLRSLLVALVLATALPFAALLAWHIAQESATERERAHERAAAVADVVASRIELKLADMASMLERLGRRPAVRALDPRRCDPMITEFVRLFPEFTTLAVRDLDGVAICSYLRDPIPRLEPLERFPWFAEGRNAAAFNAGDAFLGHQTGKWVSVMTHPVQGESEAVEGMVVMPVELATLSRQVLAGVQEDLLVVVAGRDNRVLLRSRDQDSRVGKPIPARFVERVGERQRGTLAEKGLDDAPRLYAFATVPGTGWRVFAALDEDAVFAGYRRHLRSGATAGLAALALVLAAAWAIGSAIAKPIRRLAAVAGEVASGNAGARANPGGPREVDGVARQFNHMLDAVESHRAERLAIAGHYDRLLEGARDVVLLIEPEGRIVEANGAAERAYGYSRDELVGKHMLELRTPVDEATLKAQLEAADSPEGILFETEHVRKDGSTFPVEVSARTLVIDGKPYRQSFVRDVTPRKRAEAQAAESRRRFDTAILASRQLLHEWDPATNELSIKGDTERILGYGPAEMAGGLARWRELIHPDDLGEFDASLARSVDTGSPFHQAYRVRRKDGTWATMQDDGYFVRDAAGRISCMVCFVVDVTDQRLAREAAERQFEELRRWHAAMLGREARVLELKREVNELLAAAGREPRYPSGGVEPPVEPA